MSVVQLFLFLHVMGAIIAFGPTFVFSFIAGLSRQQPQHALFGLQLSELIQMRLVLPLAVVQGITGVILVVTVPVDILATHWLALGIVLYLILLGFAFLVQRPTLSRMVVLAQAMPAPAAGGGPPAGQAPAGGPPPGPPPEMAALGRRTMYGGIFMVIVLVVIVFLMAAKPTF